MKRTGLMLAAFAFWGSPVLAADRLTDRDVKALVTRIEQGRDRFDNALDSKLKNSILRGPSGGVNLDRFLNDFQESIDRLEERLKPEYSASAEAGALLRQASDIHSFFRRQPTGTRGESEWNRLETELRALAVAYGVSFPLEGTASVRRIGDRELAEMVDGIAHTADRMKKSLDTDLKNNAAVDRPAREAVIGEADQLSKDAKALLDRVKDGDPSSSEAEKVLARATTLQSFIDSHQVPTSASQWKNLAAQLEGVATAYGAGRPGSR
jgi:hypothetical protein